MQLTHTTKTADKAIQLFFLVLLNLLLVLIIGFLTVDSFANLNSRVGGILLSVLLPMVVIYRTPGLSRLDRTFRFGMGFLLYALIILFKAGLATTVTTMVGPCMLMAMSTLYYGDAFLSQPRY